MGKKGLIFLLGVFFLFSFSACGKRKPAGIASKVNSWDKSFRSSWVYKPAITGRQEKIQLLIKGKKFRVNDNLICDGKNIYEIDARNREVKISNLKGWRSLPFWHIPLKMSPFGEAQRTREATIAGRSAEIYEIRGKYQGAEIFLIYWIDKEKKVLLKKEHIIGPRNDPLVYEFYECKSIEFNPVISEKDFAGTIPSGYLKIKVGFISSNLLDNKF